MKKGIEIWTEYDKAGNWVLRIKKQRGKFTLDEIQQICIEYEQDFYMLVICAMDREVMQFYDTEDLGDFVTLYRADDFFKWREKNA